MRRLTEALRRAVHGDRAVVRRRRRWLRRGTAIRLGVAALACAGLAAGGGWLWRAGHVAAAAEWASEAAVAGLGDLGLRVATVTLEGRTHAPRPEVAAAVGLKVGDPIFSFHPETVRKRLVALPWIRDAEVARRLPDAVSVRIRERTPFALWQRHGALSLIDEDGAVITRRGLERFQGLVVIVGEDAPRHAASLFRALAREPELFGRVRAAVRVGERRWDVRLDNDVDVRLPEGDAAAAWLRLAEIERQYGILASGVSTVDLRTADWLVLRLKHGATLGRRHAGKST
jgi:cell division protein FtsQ